MSRPQDGDWLEGRRMRAWELKQQGWSNAEIARALGVTPGAVSQWMTRTIAGGIEALRRRIAPGPTPRLTEAQGTELLELLARGAEAFGFRGDVWTGERIAWLIEQTFGVRYHPAHVSRLVRALGWSSQKPVTRATQRDEDAIIRWFQERWPALRKKARKEGRIIVWVDESGFYLLPAVVRTYAPRGQTPVLRVPLTRDHLSVISGITLDDRLFLLVREQSFSGPGVVEFLRHLVRHLGGLLLVIWDGAPIHRGQAVKEFLATTEGQRIQVEPLPGYAPDANPDEGIWNYLKRVELRNVCFPSLQGLRDGLRRAVARLRHKRTIIHSCFQLAGYNV